ncbi:hypothetical protein A3I51_01385 [Candidatus Gottesmanbacteria bacterium RIFCSPLOWO2_02_FULL_38_8]|uniref:Uncharacterized protein n=1 Tax=Candidatus Gottesmanbacteria bacterium RIFCSPLOWO2_02_FULL_38_8 TaxID=1798397 RepID=A0A1F6B360_9BACT|nr:MAG: hypothetical protein A3I51_01385 [Candidatus Gottesmanbacteria bacterium RIFCSPLOWO2_02_FULL_38_8]
MFIISTAGYYYPAAHLMDLNLPKVFLLTIRRPHLFFSRLLPFSPINLLLYYSLLFLCFFSSSPPIFSSNIFFPHQNRSDYFSSPSCSRTFPLNLPSSPAKSISSSFQYSSYPSFLTKKIDRLFPVSFGA